MKGPCLALTALLCLTAVAGQALAQPADLALVFVGGDAVFIDTASLKRKDGAASFRILRVSAGAETIMAQPYAAAWWDAAIDCKAGEHWTLATTKLAENGQSQARELLTGEVFPVAAGTAEAALEAIVCAERPAFKDLVSGVVEAIRIGRARLSQAR